MAAELGFEPRHTESESAVLPLHNSAMHRFFVLVYFITAKCVCQDIFLKIWFCNYYYQKSAIIYVVIRQIEKEESLVLCLAFLFVYCCLLVLVFPSAAALKVYFERKPRYHKQNYENYCRAGYDYRYG